MPELPEVETVRDGLQRLVVGRIVADVTVLRDYSIRQHAGGASAFEAALVGRRFGAAVRRGKFLWIPLLDDGRQTEPQTALLAHLGMSGQLRVDQINEAPTKPGSHVRVRLQLGPQSQPTSPGSRVPGSFCGRVARASERIETPPAGTDPTVTLDFVDQRTFGHLSVVRLVPTDDGLPGGQGSLAPAIPETAAHIARDLLDESINIRALAERIRQRRTGIKRALLDQRFASGIGNIYADEALWRASVHYASATDQLPVVKIESVLLAARDVMSEALIAGGTSFDSLYVNVNGASGYFSRSLKVYGQQGKPCPRCGTAIMRENFMNRGSHFCPTCQRRR